MLTTMLLLVAQCAEPYFCPSNVDLERAVRDYREKAETAFFLSLSEEERGGTTLTPWPIVTRISDHSCGALTPRKHPSVLCRVVLHFPKGAEETSFRLQRINRVWNVIEEVGR